MRTGRVMRKRGFTLIETVVTVGIVATLAAVVIPQVASQFDTADPTRLQNDLKNIQAAVEVFNVNIKALPGDLDDLANQPTDAGDSTLTTATTITDFTATEVGLWQGPYFDVSVPDALGPNVDASIVTGYSASIQDSFVCYSATNNESGVSEGTAAAAGANDAGCSSSGTGQKFLAFQITGITCSTSTGATFLAINELFDGTSETTPAASGRVRCRAAGSAGTGKTTDVAVVYFLAVPIS